MQKRKIIISGGGTGGHIFPAISIANALKEIDSDIEILFVGAEGKMEMEKVPNAGYEIVGLPIRGLQRNFSKENLKFLPRLIMSLIKAKSVIKGFKPDAVVGVGGYASGPLLYMANKLGIVSLIQEQNSYAGLTNKILAKSVDKICVAYEEMDRFFPASKIKFTGNPVRKDLQNLEELRSEGIQYFNLDSEKKTILVIGGSLGARTMNESVLSSIAEIEKNDNVQFLWQTGKYYFETASDKLKKANVDNIHVHDFISRMDLAYSVADLVLSRAGAGTISELCLVKKACILIPSPNVAEDHQTKNALALVNTNAAEMVKDSEAINILIDKALFLVDDVEKLKKLKDNIASLAKPNAANDIAAEILSLISK